MSKVNSGNSFEILSQTGEERNTSQNSPKGKTVKKIYRNKLEEAQASLIKDILAFAKKMRRGVPNLNKLCMSKLISLHKEITQEFIDYQEFQLYKTSSEYIEKKSRLNEINSKLFKAQKAEKINKKVRKDKKKKKTVLVVEKQLSKMVDNLSAQRKEKFSKSIDTFFCEKFNFAHTFKSDFEASLGYDPESEEVLKVRKFFNESNLACKQLFAKRLAKECQFSYVDVRGVQQYFDLPLQQPNRKERRATTNKEAQVIKNDLTIKIRQCAEEILQHKNLCQNMLDTRRVYLLTDGSVRGPRENTVEYISAQGYVVGKELEMDKLTRRLKEFNLAREKLLLEQSGSEGQ